jgi:hypothetical protein
MELLKPKEQSQPRFEISRNWRDDERFLVASHILELGSTKLDGILEYLEISKIKQEGAASSSSNQTGVSNLSVDVGEILYRWRNKFDEELENETTYFAKNKLLKRCVSYALEIVNDFKYDDLKPSESTLFVQTKRLMRLQKDVLTQEAEWLENNRRPLFANTGIKINY